MVTRLRLGPVWIPASSRSALSVSRAKKGIFAGVVAAVMALGSPNARADESLFETNTLAALNISDQPSPPGADLPREKHSLRNTAEYPCGKSERAEYLRVAEYLSRAFGYDPVVICGLIAYESKGDVQAVSLRHAQGLFQITRLAILDFEGKHRWRWYNFYGPLLRQLRIQDIWIIPDDSIRNALLRYIGGDDTRENYQKMVQVLTKNLNNPYSSMILWFLCLKSFEDSVMRQNPKNIVQSVKSGFSRLNIEWVNRSRAFNSFPGIFGKIWDIDPDVAIMAKILEGYSGTKWVHYAAVAGAFDDSVPPNNDSSSASSDESAHANRKHRTIPHPNQANPKEGWGSWTDKLVRQMGKVRT